VTTWSGDGPGEPERPSMGDGAVRLPVRWRDLDPLGHVNAAVFLTYLDEGRASWLTRVLGDGFDAAQYVVARIELDYRAEIPQGTLFIDTHHAVRSVGRSSITFDEHLTVPDGTVVAESRTVLVMWEPGGHQSRSLSLEERSALTSSRVN